MAENVSGSEKPQNGGNNRGNGQENKSREKRDNTEGRQGGKKSRDGYQRRNNNRGDKGQRQQREQGQFQEERIPKPIKKREETVEDIRSENARITKEIYLDIASIKNINLD